MAHRMSTRLRMDRIREKSAESRTVNGHLKRKERVNREARMKELLQKGTFPYTPSIMSWVSAQLGKPTTQITADEVQTLLK